MNQCKHDAKRFVAFCKQLYRHEPEIEIVGDCWRTCIANILGLNPWQVPNFILSTDDDAEEKWLGRRGLHIYTYNCDGDMQQSLRSLSSLAPGQVFIFGGESSNHVNHAVLARDGEIVFDPSQDDSGIIGPLIRSRVYDGVFILNKKTHEMIDLEEGESQ